MEKRMRTILDYRGIEKYLSEEVYEIIAEQDLPGGYYIQGQRVRLISGIGDRLTPGYHFNQAYFTVCRVDAEIAEFAGIKKADLRKVE